MTVLSLKIFLKALNFSAEQHKLQKRKGDNGVPYINHPIQVVALLSEYESETNYKLLTAAILHDVIEDTTVNKNDVKRYFGDEVANLVSEVTDNMLLPKQIRKSMQVKKAGDLSREAKLIKIADKTCNLKDIVNLGDTWDVKRKKAYFEWAKKVVDQCRGVNSQLEEYFDKVYREGKEELRV